VGLTGGERAGRDELDGWRGIKLVKSDSRWSDEAEYTESIDGLGCMGEILDKRGGGVRSRMSIVTAEHRKVRYRQVPE
jgi:hypothetical protein